MADNTQVASGGGDTVRDKDRAGVKTQIVGIDLNIGGAETLMVGSMPVTAASLPLPAGASTEATLAAQSAKMPATLGQKAMAASLAVVLASDQSALAVSGTFWQATQPVSGTVTSNVGTGTRPISATSLPLPTGASTEATLDARTGSLTETAPASDTASSGLNGRLQRVAQRLTSLIALLPTALGTGGGLKVDGSGTALPVSGTVTANAGTGTLAVSAASLPLPTGASTETTLATLKQRPATSAVAQVTSSAATGTLQAANANRLGLTIYNDSTSILYVKFGTTASATSYTVKMTADSYYEMPFGYTGRVDGIWTTANGFAYLTEMTA